jgi:hypothetical protein
MLDKITALENELSHYKEFYELMRKACPAEYIAYKESSAAEGFADKAILTIKDMQTRKELRLNNYALRVSTLRYLQYFYESEYSGRGEDYEATGELSEAAIFYSEADAQAAAKRLKDTDGVIAEIFKLPKIL